MKKVFLFTAMLLSISFYGFSQELAGRKIINGSLNLNVISPKGANSLTEFNTSLLVGKIKEDNTYWAFGGRVSTTNLSGDIYMVGPAVERGKFIKMVDKLYFAPYAGAYAQGIFGDLKGFNASVYASPLRFMYHISESFILTASMGSASLQLNKTKNLTSFNLNGSMTNNSGIGVFYTFK